MNANWIDASNAEAFGDYVFLRMECAYGELKHLEAIAGRDFVDEEVQV